MILVTPRINGLDQEHKAYYRQLTLSGYHSFETPLFSTYGFRPETLMNLGFDETEEYIHAVAARVNKNITVSDEVLSVLLPGQLLSFPQKPSIPLTHHSEMRSDFVLSIPTVGLNDDQVKIVQGAADWMIKAVHTDPSDAPVSAEEISLMRSILKTAQVASFSTVVKREFAAIGLQRSFLLSLFLWPPLFAVNVLSGYLSARFQAYAIFDDLTRTINFRAFILSSPKLFLKVTRHELAHALGYDDYADTFAMLGFFEDENVPLEEADILRAYPSPVLKEIFSRAKTQGFPDLFRDENLLEKKGYGYSDQLSLVKEDWEVRRLWHNQLHSPEGRARMERIKKILPCIHFAERNFFRPIRKRLSRFFIVPQSDYYESYANQIAYLGMVVSFISTFPDLSNEERYQYAKVMIARSKDSGMAASAEYVRELIAERSALRTQTSSDQANLFFELFNRRNYQFAGLDPYLDEVWLKPESAEIKIKTSSNTEQLTVNIIAVSDFQELLKIVRKGQPGFNVQNAFVLPAYPSMSDLKAIADNFDFEIGIHLLKNGQALVYSGTDSWVGGPIWQFINQPLIKVQNGFIHNHPPKYGTFRAENDGEVFYAEAEFEDLMRLRPSDSDLESALPRNNMIINRHGMSFFRLHPAHPNRHRMKFSFSDPDMRFFFGSQLFYKILVTRPVRSALVEIAAGGASLDALALNMEQLQRERGVYTKLLNWEQLGDKKLNELLEDDSKESDVEDYRLILDSLRPAIPVTFGGSSYSRMIEQSDVLEMFDQWLAFLDRETMPSELRVDNAETITDQPATDGFYPNRSEYRFSAGKKEIKTNNIYRKILSPNKRYVIMVDTNTFAAFSPEQRQAVMKYANHPSGHYQIIFNLKSDAPSKLDEQLLADSGSFKNVSVRINPVTFKIPGYELIYLTKDTVIGHYEYRMSGKTQDVEKAHVVRYRIDNQQPGLETAAVCLLESNRDNELRVDPYLTQWMPRLMDGITQYLSGIVHVMYSA